MAAFAIEISVAASPSVVFEQDWIVVDVLREQGEPMLERGIGYVVAGSGRNHGGGSGKRLRVGFLLARQFTMSAFALFVDTLRLASDVEDKSGRRLCDWDVLSPNTHMIRSSCGVQLVPTTGLGDPERFDYIVVIGGLLDVEEQLSYESIGFLRRAIQKGVRLVGACTGSFVLADAGLLDGKTACVSWLHHSEFKARFPEIRLTSQRLFVEDGNVTTCAGGSAVADLAALLVRRHVGEGAERNAMEILQLDRRREGSDLQSRMPIALPIHCDERIRAALLYMEENIDDRLEIEKIADRVGLSRRQLERIFKTKTGFSPATAYEKICMKKAAQLVERTSKTMIDIALDVGFASSSHFCRRFRANFGMTPHKLREKMRNRNQQITESH
ncbi:MAG: GlxA family transcriptional regulator [Shinella sp.]